MDYQEFLNNKRSQPLFHGINESQVNDKLFDFQKFVTIWLLKKGRAAYFAECGLGKTPVFLSWSDIISRETNKRILILTPLAVSFQTVLEGEKFGIEVIRSVNGKFDKSKKIIVTNYERLHHFDPNDFIGGVCDESGVLKNFQAQRKKYITDFFKKTQYRLLCTATPSPNDYHELGTSSEALGEMGYMDMLATFFKNNEKSLHPIWWGTKWMFKAHAENDFWRWVCSWAKAVKKPSDLGNFDDSKFDLPPLINTEYIVKDNRITHNGKLYVDDAVTLQEQRLERKNTLRLRCEKVSELVEKHPFSIVWCHLNSEGDFLEKIIPNSIQVSGKDKDEVKEEKLLAFINKQVKRLIIKPKIGGFGLNLQHCGHATFFPSHSFEQWYQSVRRIYRFGREGETYIDMITSRGEKGVLRNLERKQRAADKMYSNLVKHMNNSLKINNNNIENIQKNMEIPSWI